MYQYVKLNYPVELFVFNIRNLKNSLKQWLYIMCVCIVCVLSTRVCCLDMIPVWWGWKVRRRRDARCNDACNVGTSPTHSRHLWLALSRSIQQYGLQVSLNSTVVNNISLRTVTKNGTCDYKRTRVFININNKSFWFYFF